MATNVYKVYDKIMDEIQKFLDTRKCKLTQYKSLSRDPHVIMLGERHFEYGGQQYVGVVDCGYLVWFIPESYWRFDTEDLVAQGVFQLVGIDKFTTPDVGEFTPIAYLGIGGKDGTIARFNRGDYSDSRYKDVTPAFVRKHSGADYHDILFNAKLIERFVKITDEFTFSVDNYPGPIYFKANDVLLGFVLPLRD